MSALRAGLQDGRKRRGDRSVGCRTGTLGKASNQKRPCCQRWPSAHLRWPPPSSVQGDRMLNHQLLILQAKRPNLISQLAAGVMNMVQVGVGGSLPTRIETEMFSAFIQKTYSIQYTVYSQRGMPGVQGLPCSHEDMNWRSNVQNLINS